MSKTSVFCLTKSRAHTERIVDRSHIAGFAYSEISVLMPETDSARDIGHVKASKAPEGTATGVATGGLAGGVIGLLAGIGAIAIPGIGPFIAAGPLMAALSGAALGATAGGVVGGLIGLGIPEIEARIYEGKLKTGNYLVSVHAETNAQIAKAKSIYKEQDGEDISATSEASTPEPKKAPTKRKSDPAYSDSIR